MSAPPTTPSSQQFSELSLALIQLARTTPAGFDQQQAHQYLIKAQGAPIPVTELATAISSLTSTGRLLAFQHGGKYRWKLEDDSRFTKLQGLSSMDRIIYQVIEAAKNQGIWSKDLRRRTNSQGNSDFDKSIKFLLQRKLIKVEDSIAAKNKKVYMLYELTPALEVSGSVWYSTTTKDIDVKFVENLKQAVLLILEKKGPCTPELIYQRLVEKKTLQVELTIQQLETLCYTLVHDGFVEYGTYHDLVDMTVRKKYFQQYILPMQNETTEQDELEHPEPIFRLPTVPDIESIDLNAFSGPCVNCSLIDVCGSGNVIEPESCEYFAQWIGQNDTIETAKQWTQQWERHRWLDPSQPPLGSSNNSMSMNSTQQ